MRHLPSITMLIVGLLLGSNSLSLADEPALSSIRYGIRSDLELYPQASPQEALASVVRAIESDDVAYLLAQLVWPDEVDKKFAGDQQKLKALASKGTPERRRKMANAIERHAKHGKWTIEANSARSQVADLPDITLAKRRDRWFMHNVPGEK